LGHGLKGKQACTSKADTDELLLEEVGELTSGQKGGNKKFTLSSATSVQNLALVKSRTIPRQDLLVEHLFTLALLDGRPNFITVN
jgi:hypothetical protein